MFAVFITNILIAIVCDAYEIHADRAELLEYDPFALAFCKQVCFILIFRWLPGKLIPNWAQKMKLCATVKARTLVHLYLHPENEGKFLSEKECIECNLPEISKKGNDVEMSYTTMYAFIEKTSKEITKPILMKGRKFSMVFKEKNFEETLWSLYSYKKQNEDNEKEDRGNFVRRVLSAELDRRQIESKIDLILNLLQQEPIKENGI